LAHLPTPAASPSGILPELAAQSIYSHLELPAIVSATVGGLTVIRGWIVDCPLGSFPPSLRLMETKPDGSSREIPNDFFFTSGIARPDVQAAVGASCPAVYNAPSTLNTSLGPNDGFGFSVGLRSPIKELGAHVFTVIASWSAQGHSGSSSVTVTVVQ
jgi:hypothetical protein